MREPLNSYLAQNPASSLNMYRDLYIAQLERNVDLELQKFSLDFNSLPPQQKEIFLSELDKAVTSINLMRGVIADINKQVEAEQARAAYFEAVDAEKLKKEQDELQERKMLASLGAAMEIAALKTSASMSTEMPPSLAAVEATEEIDNKFAQSIKLIDEQLIKATELLLSKVKIVADADSSLAGTGFMDENGKMGVSDALFNVIQWQENVEFIAGELGIRPRDVNMLNLKVVGDVDGELVFIGDESKRMSFSRIAGLLGPTQRKHATDMNQFLLTNVATIRLFVEKRDVERGYLEEKQLVLATSHAQSFEWRAAILAERGITIDASRAEEQIATLKANSPQSFRELILREEAAQAIMIKKAQEFEADRKVIQEAQEFKRYNMLEELQKPRNLRKSETIDKSAPNFKLFMKEKDESLKGNFTKIVKDSKANPKKFTEIVEDSKNQPISAPYPPLPGNK